MGEARLPRRSRLTAAADFEAVFSDHVRSSGGGFTVLARANDLQRPRLGMAVPKRAVRRAVDRNRVKRLVRESFRSSRKLVAMDYVVIARNGVERLDNGAVLRSLDQHWHRIRSRCGSS